MRREDVELLAGNIVNASMIHVQAYVRNARRHLWAEVTPTHPMLVWCAVLVLACMCMWRGCSVACCGCRCDYPRSPRPVRPAKSV